jgi:hypothetical protein
LYAAVHLASIDGGVIEIVEIVSFSSWSRMRPLNASQIPFCIGFPGAMKCQAVRLL